MKFDKTSRTAAVLGVVGVLLAGGLAGCSGDGGAETAPSGTASAAAPESTAAAADAAGTVSASGTVESARVASLSFATGGIITDVNVKAGKKVAKGSLLATVDATVPTESMNAAYTAYVAAQDGYADAKKDQKKQLYAALVEARNGYRKARREVEGTKIYAPFAGTVTSVTAVADAEAAAGAAMVTLADLKDLRVTANFTEADTTLLKEGQKATVTFASLDETVKGKVVSVAPTPAGSSDTAESGGGGFQQSATEVVQYEVLVSLSARPAKIRTGLPVTVEVTTG